MGGGMGGGGMGGGGMGGGGGPHHNRLRPPHRIQTFDSNGPNVKIRGNAYQVFERYVAMAREAQSSGDRVAAENLYQHAEHYFRVMNAIGEGQGQGAPRPTTPADLEMATGDGYPRGGESREDDPRDGDPREGEEAQMQPTHQPPLPSPGDEQPPSY